MPRVICLGEILLDRFSTSAVADVHDSSGWQNYPGGAPANVAVNLAKLGIESVLVGCVGQDPHGQFLLEFLQQAGVNTTAVQPVPAPTRQVFVTTGEDGDRQFVHTTGNADLYLAPHHLHENLFEGADFLVLGTIPLAHANTSRAVGRALKLAETYFVKVVVDINWRPLFWQNPAQAGNLITVLLKHTDFLKASAQEAMHFFRTTAPSAIGQKFPHLEGIIVTEGDKGCRYYLGGRQSRCQPIPVTSIDTTGAGDAFVAGFVSELCRHSLKDLENPVLAHKIIQFASAGGALTTTTIGAVHPHMSREAVENLIRHGHPG
jgi:fructokinase